MREQRSKKRYFAEVILEKLPPLRRESTKTLRLPPSYTSQPRSNKPEDWEQKAVAVKDQALETGKNWQNPDPVQRKYSLATSRHKMISEEKEDDISMDKSGMDSIFPLKPVCHKRPFNLNNCQADSNYFIQKDQRRLYYHLPHSSQSKQTNNKRQWKNDLSKLEPFDTESQQPLQEQSETNGKSNTWYQTLHEDQSRHSDNQIQLTKEIRKKEIMLQEKLLKAEQELRKIQLKTVDKVKREERNNTMKKEENRVYCNEKGNWDWEIAKEGGRRPLGGRRDKGQERVRERDWWGSKDDVEQWEKSEIETNMIQRQNRRDGLQWENSRKTKTTDFNIQGKVSDNSKEMEPNWEIGRKNTRTRREKAVEWDWNEIKELERADWQGMGRVSSREKRGGEISKIKRDLGEGEDEQRWNITDRFKSNPRAKVKVFSQHDQINRLESDRWPSDERLYQHKRWAVEEKTTESIKKGLAIESSIEAVPCSPHHNPKGKRLQQVELSPEDSSNANIHLRACKICHRLFTEDRLDEHSRVCEKVQHSKRKIFDSSKYRAKGTDLENFIKANNGTSKSPEIKKNNWRQKHEAFIRNLRQARGPATGDFQPDSSADLNPDYISCPHCGRRFAPGPAERHIPKCQNIKSRPPPPRHRR